MVSSLVFAMAHALNGPTLLGWLNLFFFGIMAALWALAEGGLWGASAWHAGWNWTLGSLLGMAVDRSSRSGLLISVRATGPGFITGGPFGPDGGIAATGVLLIGIGILAIRTDRFR
jgi:hypothetical protein